MLTQQKLTDFIKENLFTTIDEFTEKLQKEFNLNKEDIRFELTNGESYIKIITPIKDIKVTIEVED